MNDQTIPEGMARDASLMWRHGAGISRNARGMAIQALAGEIVAALLADEKDGGYDLTAGMFGPAFSTLVRRWVDAELLSLSTSDLADQQRGVLDDIVVKLALIGHAGPSPLSYKQIPERLRQALDALRHERNEAVFALQAAWPYVHGWCTIQAQRRRISGVLTKHGDFADMEHARLAVKEAAPVAYGIFAQIPGEGWVLQFPNYRTQVDAERAAGTFTVGHVEVRPLYA